MGRALGGCAWRARSIVHSLSFCCLIYLATSPLSLQVVRHVGGEGAEENGGEGEAGAGVGGRDEMAAEEGAEGAGLDDGEQFEVRRWCSFELLIRIAHKSLTPVG